MKKTIIALLALGSVASATNYYGGAETNPFTSSMTDYTAGQDFTLSFTLGSTLNASYDSATILILDSANWGVSTQTGQHVGLDVGANGVDGAFAGRGTDTAFSSTEKKEGWFINYGSGNAINGITITVEGTAATNSTVLTFAKEGKDTITMTLDKLLTATDINLGSALDANKMTASNISFTSTPEPATATLSLLALAGLASRRRRH